MSGGVFLLGKSQKRDISPFPGSPGPFSDLPTSPQSPRNFSLLERKTRVYLGGSSTDDLSLPHPHSGTALTPDFDLRGQAVRMATRGESSER